VPHVCADASLVVKFVLVEEDSAIALSLWRSWLDTSVTPIAPSFMAYEAVTAIRTRAFHGDLSPAEAEEAYSYLESLAIIFVEPAGLIRRAWELAWELDQPTIYEAVYAALAEADGCELWTADKAFYRAASPKLPYVRLLAHFRRNATDAAPR